MTTKPYFIVQENVVTNCVLWDGNTEIWAPPQNAIMLIVESTPAMIWELNQDKTDYILVEQIGAGDIGFTWGGSVLTTNQPKPVIPTQS